MKPSKVIAVIPSRYGSTRFPGKPLVDIQGKSMIQRVYEQVYKFCTNATIVATDSQEIFDHVVKFGGNVIMTSDQHQSGTERCCEIAQHLLSQKKIGKNDVIINIQGDEPFIKPEQIEDVLNCFSKRKVKIATLIKQIKDKETVNNPNVVKVVTDAKGRALYFSRSAIPCCRSMEQRDQIPYWKHIGIYGYRVKTLLKLVKLDPSPLEQSEMLEQLRWLENGYKIYTNPTTEESISIDTPQDLEKVKSMMIH